MHHDEPGRVAQSVGHLTRKYMHEVLVNHLGGLSMSRKIVVRLTDRPDMTWMFTVDVNQTTTQQQHNDYVK